MANSQQFSLRWNNYLSHIRGAFDTLRADEDLVDVTLSCEGKRIKAHKMLLSACSPYFREIFKENPCQHPVIVFHHVKYDDLEALVTFMYQGEVNVAQESLSSFLNTAEVLEVQGLTGGSKAPFETSKEDDEQTETDSESKSKKQNVPKIVSPVLQYPDSPPNKKRKQNSGIEVNQQSCEDMKLESGTLNVEAEYYDNDSTEPYDEPTSCSEAFLQEALTERGYTCPGEDSGEGLSSLDRGAGTSSEGVLHDSLQVFAHGLWRRLHPSLKQFGCDECGKVFKHPRSLDHHKKMHEGRTTCPVCRRVFGRMYALRLHMSSSHPDHSDLHLHKPKGCLNPLH